LPISSVSDFEQFALKIEKSIAIKVKAKESDASSYVLQKEKDTLVEITQWKEHSVIKWEQELNARELRGEKALTNDLKQQWSVFKKEQEVKLRGAFKQKLENSFDVLAKCFISWVSHKYTTGSLTMAKKYMTLVENGQFDLKECQRDQVVFSNGNLYIEYSVDRIMEELGDEIVKSLHFEEDEWQV